VNSLNSLSGATEAVGGRTSEFVQLLTGAQSRLYAYICSLIGTAAGARDVLQETNVVLWDKAHEFDRARPFLPWAYRIAFFQVLAYRKQCARSRLVFDEQLVNEVSQEFLRHDDNHDRQLEALGLCLDKLPRPRRDLIDRRYERGESVDQIARELRKPPNVVSASLYRIRKMLLECIEAGLAVG
jgi:RNA polymerase sigma-70 factor, ECF subfamily